MGGVFLGFQAWPGATRPAVVGRTWSPEPARSYSARRLRERSNARSATREKYRETNEDEHARRRHLRPPPRRHARRSLRASSAPEAFRKCHLALQGVRPGWRCDGVRSSLTLQFQHGRRHKRATKPGGAPGVARVGHRRDPAGFDPVAVPSCSDAQRRSPAMNGCPYDGISRVCPRNAFHSLTREPVSKVSIIAEHLEDHQFRGHCQLVEGSALLPRDIDAPDRFQQAHVTTSPSTNAPVQSGRW